MKDLIIIGVYATQGDREEMQELGANIIVPNLKILAKTISNYSSSPVEESRDKLIERLKKFDDGEVWGEGKNSKGDFIASLEIKPRDKVIDVGTGLVGLDTGLLTFAYLGEYLGFDLNYDISDSSQFMRRIYRLRHKDPKTWYYPLTSRVSSRMLELEQTTDDEYAALIRGAMGLGAFAVHSYIPDEEHTLLIQSAAPADSWMTWLPYEIGADFRNGGLVVSWLPGIDLTESLSFDLRITPVHLNRYAGEEIWFSQADLFLSYNRSGFFSSFGIGPTYTYTWKDWPGAKQNNLGASLYIAMLQDKLRLTIGERDFNENSFAGESIYLSISVMDIPGFAYWLTKGN